MATKKMCSQCGIAKPVNKQYFYAHKDCKDGFSGLCKICKRKNNNANKKQVIASKEATEKRRISQFKAGGKKSVKVNLHCEVDQYVIHKGKTVCVTQVIEQGRNSSVEFGVGVPARKANIAACKVDSRNGMPLTRSSVYPGTDWQHIK